MRRSSSKLAFIGLFLCLSMTTTSLIAQGTLPIEKLIEVYNNPAKYPDYIMVSAHRGYWKDVPENSLPAIEAAIAMGVDMVELDVTRTDYSENVLYLLHDWGLDRLTDGHGIVKKRIDGELNHYQKKNK